MAILLGGVGCQGPADPMDDKILRARRRKAAGWGDIQMRAHIEIRSRETAVCLRERERKKVEAREENRGY